MYINIVEEELHGVVVKDTLSEDKRLELRFKGTQLDIQLDDKELDILYNKLREYKGVD